jgi:protein involved in polysaccharide export with SLBB domain
VVRLSPYDNILVRRQPGWEAPRLVALTGQVKYPGRYTLRSRDDRLTELLARAGGLTPQAYPNGIRFFRATAPHDAASAEDTSGGFNRVGVDLPRVLRESSHRDNLVLIAGDSVHIPEFIPLVRVEGAVNFPTSVTFREGAGIGYYIDAAGGFTRSADKKATHVQQPNGLVQKGVEPEAGAVIVVPSRDPTQTNPFNMAAVLGLAGQLITAATTVLVVLLSK